jgi:hypothetical protein
MTTLAQATSDNAPGGAVLTFAFPIILFAIIGGTLWYLLFVRPHRRVPSSRIVLAASGSGAPQATAAHAAAVAAGLPTASGGGSAESAAEAHGAKRDTLAEAADGTGSVSGGTGESDQGTTEGMEANE